MNRPRLQSDMFKRSQDREAPNEPLTKLPEYLPAAHARLAVLEPGALRMLDGSGLVKLPSHAEGNERWQGSQSEP